jgi:cyclopropane fatty-acyl-phospholipid synthase-like methyltransferase
MPEHSEIEKYYDANTRHFLRFGGSGDTAAIHRAIWAPKVATKAEAFGYINALIAQELAPLLETDPQTLSFLDLGCGVGGTATQLHQQLGISVTGVSLSAKQIAIANARSESLGVSQHVSFIQADFAQMPEQNKFNAACAIESFVHCQDAGAFFEMVAQRLQSGGKLIICDDFLGESNSDLAIHYRARFKSGWHINQLLSVDQLEHIAAQHGLTLHSTRDLSEYIKPFPSPLLWTVNHVTRLPLPWPYWHNLSGGTSLQRCLKNRWMRYCALVFERA